MSRNFYRYKSEASSRLTATCLLSFNFFAEAAFVELDPSVLLLDAAIVDAEFLELFPVWAPSFEIIFFCEVAVSGFALVLAAAGESMYSWSISR